jgi:hypothetical protein
MNIQNIIKIVSGVLGVLGVIFLLRIIGLGDEEIKMAASMGDYVPSLHWLTWHFSFLELLW